MWAAEDCVRSDLTVRGNWGSAVFDVTIADDPKERAQGLMFVQDMPSRVGMLFLYPSSAHVAFWMKNTLIPLDMLFIDEKGIVTQIHQNAIPGDLTPIRSTQEVVAVLELNGGISATYGIEVGSTVEHQVFSQSSDWPCETK